MSDAIQNEILRNMVDKRLQTNKANTEQVTVNTEQVTNQTRGIKTTNRLINPSQATFEFDSSIINKKFTDLPKTTAAYTRGGFLKNLRRGSIVAISEWTLKPAHGVTVVSHVTEQWVVTIDGGRFNRKDGLSIDGRRLMLQPMYSKSRYYLIQNVRKKLGLTVMMEAA